MNKHLSIQKTIAYLAASTIAWAGYNSDYIPLAQVVAPPAMDYLLNDNEHPPSTKDKRKGK